MNNESFMKEKPVIGLVLSMSLPMVFSMMVNALYNIVDSFFVAKISEDAMTALSLVFPVQNLMSAVSIGFGVGINAVIAFFLGAGEKKKADQAASLGFFWNAVQGLVLTVVCIAIIPVFLRLFSNDERTIGYALEYSRIVFLFGVIISCSLSFEKIFQAVGRMKVSMAGLLVGCLTNIILDPIFIFGLHMDVRGAALATIIFCERGLPFLYQGQEIGMSNRQWKYDEFNDLETINQYQIALKAGMSKEQALEIARHHSRDNARTPMQWSSEENAGFSKGKPWMPVNENYKVVNVAEEEKEYGSILNFYKRLIAFYKSEEYNEILTYGDFRPIYEKEDHIFAYSRSYGCQKLVLICNFSSKEKDIELSEDYENVIFVNYEQTTVIGNTLKMKPYECVIYEM